MTIRIKGDKELMRALDRLPDKFRASTLEHIALDALKPMEAAYKANAPPSVAPGVRTRTVGRRPRHVTVATGSRHPLAHIFEFGTQLRTRLSGAITGRIRPRPFARPAFDQNVEGTIRNIGQSVWRVIRGGN